MASDVGGSGVDLEALNQALSNAKLHLDQAVSHLGGDLSASRLSRLADQNTSCQNSGCGGGAAAVEAAQPEVAAGPA
jgi:hypothetical protein